MKSENRPRFDGKTALITGSSQGIGRGIGLSLAREGADLIINYRSGLKEAENTAADARELGSEVLICQADVSDRGQVEEMFQKAVNRFGKLDIVVANAAYSYRDCVLDVEWDKVEKVIEVSQFGVFHTCQFAAQQMVKQPLADTTRGKIIVISSILAEFPPPANAAYNMSKRAVNALAETLASELAEHRINVNVINPGLIDTPGERKYATEKELLNTASRIPWKRLGSPEDIGKAAAFLASTDADYVTGATLRVDGGFLLGLQLPPGNEE